MRVVCLADRRGSDRADVRPSRATSARTFCATLAHQREHVARLMSSSSASVIGTDCPARLGRSPVQLTIRLTTELVRRQALTRSPGAQSRTRSARVTRTRVSSSHDRPPCGTASRSYRVAVQVSSNSSIGTPSNTCLLLFAVTLSPCSALSGRVQVRPCRSSRILDDSS